MVSCRDILWKEWSPDCFPASCGSDRSVIIYDLRTSMPVSKTVLKFACNAVNWNPMEAFNFAVASEDHNGEPPATPSRPRALLIQVPSLHIRLAEDGPSPERAQGPRRGCHGRGILAHRRGACNSFLRPHNTSMEPRQGPFSGRLPYEAHAKGFPSQGESATSPPWTLGRQANTDCFLPSLPPTASTFFRAATTAIFGYGGPMRPAAKASSRHANARPRSTTRLSSRDTSTCPRSDAFTGTGTCRRL